jgi:hypothetical protein
MNAKPVDRFEALARRLVEGSFDRLFGGRLDVADISAEIARAIELNQIDNQIPDQYQVELNPTDYAFWQEKHPTLAQDLASLIVDLARRTDAALASWPHVELAANTGLGRNQVVVRTDFNAVSGAETDMFERVSGHTEHLRSALHELDAFLIVSGKRHVSLDKPLLRIGRRAANDIVIDMPTVSREHAQIRWRFGRFIIYDLGSRGGTFVNDQRVDECVLQPGDVISLSDVALIYGEGLEKTRRARPIRTPDGDSTQVYNPVRVDDQQNDP